MQIECPNCSKINNVILDKKVVCGECKEELTGYKYRKFGKKVLTTTSAILIGAFGYTNIDKYLLDGARYPLEIEYALIEKCTNMDSKYITKKTYMKKRDICICSIQKTTQDVPYGYKKRNLSSFADAYTKNKLECVKSEQQ